MAADQRRKRLNGASIAGCSSLEKFRTKNKKIVKPSNGFPTKSHISLEWDGNHKRVVAKRDQVGISKRTLMPYIDFASGSHTTLADVISLPHEIFELEDFSEILSYEVWKTHLSEDERNFLRQFLPVGAESEHVLQELLDLENLHFGNPLLQWGASVCSGHLHPDAISFLERSLKDEKKAYYSSLQKYHADLIIYLQNLKKKWESCKDPEREILQKIWRSRKDSVDGISLQVSECRHGNLDRDLTASSESSSCMGDNNGCSSDYQNFSVVKGEFQARMNLKAPAKEKSMVPSTAENRGIKGEKMQKRNSPSTDSCRYMSYVKISKKQLELLKNMKQSGKSIQSRSLNLVLGDFDSLNVQPYEEFMEEEKRKLHAHWSRLAKQDVAVIHANWKVVQSQKQSIIRALEKDLKERVPLVLEDGANTEKLQDSNQKSTMVIDFGICHEQEESPEAIVHNERENAGLLMELDASVEERESPENVFRVEENYDAKGAGSDMHDDGDSVPISSEYDSHSSPEQVPSDGNSACNHMDLETETICMNDPAGVSEHSGDVITDDVGNQDVSLPGVENVWARDGMPHSYHDSVKSHDYTSTAALSLTHQPASEGQQMQLIDLESQLPGVSGPEVLVHAHPNDGSFGYSDPDRNDHLLQSLFKDQRILSYHNEQNATGLNFQSPKTVFPGNGQFPGHFAEPLQPHHLSLERREQRQHNQVYVEQSIQQNFPSDGERYLIPRQGHLNSGNLQTWITDSVPLPRTTPFQHQLRPGDILGQNWFPSEPAVRGRWNSSDVNIPGPSIGCSVSSGDQSLFSVLSHCNQLRTTNPYENSMSSSEQQQFISPRNYRLMAPPPGMSSNLQQSGHPLDYLGGRDATTSIMPVLPDEIGWMNLQHQNPGLHDPLGKPYLRSWNQ